VSCTHPPQFANCGFAPPMSPRAPGRNETQGATGCERRGRRSPHLLLQYPRRRGRRRLDEGARSRRATVLVSGSQRRGCHGRLLLARRVSCERERLLGGGRGEKYTQHSSWWWREREMTEPTIARWPHASVSPRPLSSPPPAGPSGRPGVVCGGISFGRDGGTEDRAFSPSSTLSPPAAVGFPTVVGGGGALRTLVMGGGPAWTLQMMAGRVGVERSCRGSHMRFCSAQCRLSAVFHRRRR
jgi:hypothetical protein